MFGPIKAPEDSIMNESTQSIMISPSPRALARNETSEQAGYSRYGAAGKTGRRWQGQGTLRSTRYLNNNMSVDDVKMVGYAAAITQTQV